MNENLCNVPTPNQDRLTNYLAAEAKILSGQTVQFGDRRLQRADLEFVQKQIGILQAAVRRELGRGTRFAQADFSQ